MKRERKFKILLTAIQTAMQKKPEYVERWIDEELNLTKTINAARSQEENQKLMDNYNNAELLRSRDRIRNLLFNDF